MAKYGLEEVLQNDPLGLLGDVKPKNPVLTEKDRLVTSFEEINAFLDEHGREPQREVSNMHEMKLFSRLKGIRKNPEKTAALEKHDRHGLLLGAENPEIGSLDDILNEDVLGLLDDDAEDIFTLKHVPKETTMPDYVARRKSCEDFDRFKPLFEACQKDLRESKRELYPFKDEQQIHEGYFFVLHGVLLYVESVGKRERIKGKTNARLRCIFENGTESDMLLRSLAAELYKDGRRVSEYEDRLYEQFYSVNDEDSETGYIYILKSLSDDPRIRDRENLYKIGYSRTPVEERIKNAANETTYLMAPVKIVAEYQTYNLNPQKFEQLLHNFFGHVCLNIDIFDTEGNRHAPREWFEVPLPVVDEAIKYILSGEIVAYRYDAQKKVITSKKQEA
jgi:hypothetical protein